MVVSSSIPPPPTQQLSKGSCSLHVSDHNLRVDCQRTLVPQLNSDADAASASVQALPILSVQALMELPSAIFILRTIRTRIADPCFEQKTSLWTSGHAWE